MNDKKTTEDAKVFGPNAWVYCKSHLRPHATGWCSVHVHNKVKLEATTKAEAYAECDARGFEIYRG